MTLCFRIFRLGLLAVLLGCGPSLPETAKVEGRITIDGAPVTKGTIMFYPVTGKPAVGTIAADGTYRLTTSVKDDGAIVGKHVVTIEASEIIGGDNPKRFEDEFKGVRLGELRYLVPPKYADRTTSALAAEVGSTENKINFDLKKSVNSSHK